VHAVIAQRLLRLICETCIAEYVPDEHEAGWLASNIGPDSAKRKYFRGRGCSHCNGSGYAGRTGVYEMLEMTPELVRAASDEDPNRFVEAARALLKGRTLTAHALELVLRGRSTISEALKIANQVEA
jgi:MSHA biogenesis protein MshE